MDGTKPMRRISRSLAVLHEFAGGRLEAQVLNRAYALATPTVCVVVEQKRTAERAVTSDQAELSRPSISKGAESHE
jgi:bifunctional N-acetylglucosamine-1-phosphate-uridyltransferase/glucosamine-1-phosphate-acetyltransferase GlmU-like protein